MMRRPLFAFWLGENRLSPARRSALDTLQNSGLEVVFITRDTLPDHVPAERLHPAFEYLNLAHQADYLRCYFMHHYGGGYTDIKWVAQSWLPAVDCVEASSSLWACGYEEVGPHAVSNIDHFPAPWPTPTWRRAGLKLEKKWLKYRYRMLMANSAFYFKPHTPLTRAWWQRMNERMDRLAPALARSPATTPKEKPGDIVDGRPSSYPVPWTFLLGSIQHPLSYRYRRHIALDLPPPMFEHPDYGHYTVQDG